MQCLLQLQNLRYTGTWHLTPGLQLQRWFNITTTQPNLHNKSLFPIKKKIAKKTFLHEFLIRDLDQIKFPAGSYFERQICNKVTNLGQDLARNIHAMFGFNWLWFLRSSKCWWTTDDLVQNQSIGFRRNSFDRIQT